MGRSTRCVARREVPDDGEALFYKGSNLSTREGDGSRRDLATGVRTQRAALPLKEVVKAIQKGFGCDVRDNGVSKRHGFQNKD
jgi:hypothetical protein